VPNWGILHGFQHILLMCWGWWKHP